MKQTFILKGRLVKASLADAVLPELGLEACIAEGGGRGWGRCFRQRGNVDRGVRRELLGSGERRGTGARALLGNTHRGNNPARGVKQNHGRAAPSPRRTAAALHLHKD